MVQLVGHDEDTAVIAGDGSPRHRLGERGYSLLEVLIVLSIIALVAALVGPRLIAQLDRSKVSAARVQIRSLAAAVETLHLDLGRYPTTEEGLDLLVHDQGGQDQADGWQGPYLETNLPLDPWGHPYKYRAPLTEDGRPEISSLGADGREGGVGIAADISYGDAR